MNVGNLIIERLVNGEGDINQAMLFEDVIKDNDVEHVNAWEWIKRRTRESGQVPTKELFEKNFPTFRFTPESWQPKLSWEALMAEAKDKQILKQLYNFMGNMPDPSEAGFDPVKADAYLRSYAGKPLLYSQSTIKVLSALELDKLPDPKPLIDGLIDVGTVSMLSGYRGTGKSFLAIDWACCVATGELWKDHKTNYGTVLYIAAEGGSGLRKRIRAWRDQYGDPRATLDVIIKPVQFGDPANMAELGQIIRSGDYDFVVIDTLARSSVGLEENSAKDMGQVVDELYKLRDGSTDGKCSILLVHHTGYVRGRARGSTSLEAAVDHVFTVDCPGGEQPKPGELMTLRNTKQKDRELHRDMTLRLQPVLDSAVVWEIDAPDVDTEAGTDRMKVLELLNGDGITSPEIQELTKFDQPKVSRILKALAEEGRASQNGKRDRAPVWYGV